MSHSFKLFFLLVSATTLSACTSFPTGPGMLVLPGTGKSFDQFRFDDVDCRQYASAQIGGKTANDAAIDSGVKSAVIGTAVGAAAGALIGGRNSAGVGAGSGLLMGSMVGTGTAESSGRVLQQRYDFGYQQCMFAKGHRIPIQGGNSRQPVINNSITVAPTNYLSSTPVSTPIPPPGNPPPPPPNQ